MNRPEDQLRSVDSASVHVLVDNNTDLLSTTPETVVPQIKNILRAQPGVQLSGTCLCCANWGLSLGIHLTIGGEERRVLFDAGPDPDTLHRNVDRLGYDLGSLDAMVLSHGHFDHAGGLPAVLEYPRAANAAALEFHAHQDMFVSRGTRSPEGNVVMGQDPPSPASLSEKGARCVLDPDARVLADGAVYLSGEIPRLTSYEKGFPNHVTKIDDAADWIDDPLILDERWLAVRVRDRGLIVMTACSHAGVINVLTHAKQAFPDVPLLAVIGGFHLAGPGNESSIDQTVSDFAAFDAQHIFPGHCTGWRAVAALAQAYPSTVSPISVGQTLTL